MSSDALAPFLVFISVLQNTDLFGAGLKIMGIVTVVLYIIWTLVFYQELRKLNYNYKDEQNYILFAAAYLQLVMGVVLLLYAIFLL
jgi:hypothetical protein